MHTPDPMTQPGFYTSVPIKRLGAWVVDILVITLICLVLTPFTGFLSIFVWAPFWLMVSFLYRWATLAGGSATWGMRLMAIELRDNEGQRLTGGLAFAHTLGYSVSIALAVLQVISVVLMATSARGQGLTDMALGTVAINRRLSGRY
ncbi:RDD family protein [Pseudaestuariivita sp.]|uniref:RDD family protein n=1 Tax=Pseudaestuariivita sp. TaxID=2211669 RepID=UPI0040584F8C